MSFIDYFAKCWPQCTLTFILGIILSLITKKIADNHYNFFNKNQIYSKTDIPTVESLHFYSCRDFDELKARYGECSKRYILQLFEKNEEYKQDEYIAELYEKEFEARQINDERKNYYMLNLSNPLGNNAYVKRLTWNQKVDTCLNMDNFNVQSGEKISIICERLHVPRSIEIELPNIIITYEFSDNQTYYNHIIRPRNAGRDVKRHRF